MTTVVSIIAGIIIFSFLVISHEFGHFLMARLTGVGVIEFSLGMGPTLVSKQGKRTRFSIKAIPFGGSCRMVGEDAAGGGEIDKDAIKNFIEDDDNYPEYEEENKFEKQNKTEKVDENDPYTFNGIHYSPSESFQQKSVWARMLVVVGGPLFNMIFALLISIILVCSSGTNPAIVYNVPENYGAYEAGIRNGDKIISIDGKNISVGREITLFLNVQGLSEETTVVYEREGKRYTVTYDPSYERYMMGISYVNDENPATLSEIAYQGAAEAANLCVGDIITEVDGVAIATGSDLGNYFDEHPLNGETPIKIKYTRYGAEYETVLTPQKTTGKTLGFAASYYGEEATFISAFDYGFREMVYGIKCVVYSLEMLFTGQVGLNELSGPVGIVSAIGTTITQDASYGLAATLADLMALTILLSVNLGLVNMFPFPALDGSRFLLLVMEAIVRRKLPAKAENAVNMVGFALLMILMVVILVSDIIKLF